MSSPINKVVQSVAREESAMFEWLSKELAEVKTPGFHVVEGASRQLIDAIAKSDLPLPESYKEFVRLFGNARLYRDSRGNAYRVGVFAGPREIVRREIGTVYQIGYYDDRPLYVRSTVGLDSRGESAVFEGWANGERPAANTFGEWLGTRCGDARRRYGVERWEEIVRGPAPFTEDERAIVEARRHFKWHIVGEAPNGDVRFQVTNESKRRLSSLSIGVRSKDGALNGAVHLPVGNIGPGEGAVIEFDCYKQFYPVNKIELFELPTPEPQDRERYSEFGQR